MKVKRHVVARLLLRSLSDRFIKFLYPKAFARLDYISLTFVFVDTSY